MIINMLTLFKTNILCKVYTQDEIDNRRKRGRQRKVTPKIEISIQLKLDISSRTMRNRLIHAGLSIHGHTGKHYVSICQGRDATPLVISTRQCSQTTFGKY